MQVTDRISAVHGQHSVPESFVQCTIGVRVTFSSMVSTHAEQGFSEVYKNLNNVRKIICL